LAAEKFVKDDSQAVLVAGRKYVMLSPFGLFWGYIGWRAKYHPNRKRKLARLGPVGNSEIHEVNGPAVIEADVCRFHIAVDDPLTVGVS
jgi:hypothetical protein